MSSSDCLKSIIQNAGDIPNENVIWNGICEVV